MVPVLGRMERRGISIDRQVLARLSGEFAQRAAALEGEIQKLAGEPLNPGSPKQLGDILFGKMGLPGGTKTKTGAWSTGARTLEELAEQGHALPQKILDWRQVAKLRSTYTDALPGYVNPNTHRVHTSFRACLDARPAGSPRSSPTCRTSRSATRKAARSGAPSWPRPAPGSCPPIIRRSSCGCSRRSRTCRRCATPSSDGVDIHAMTASEMFGVPVKSMPGDVRRRAKAINFGIIYGISAFGLAAQLGIEREEAGAYIRNISSASPASATIWRRARRSAASTAMCSPFRPQVPLS